MLFANDPSPDDIISPDDFSNKLAVKDLAAFSKQMSSSISNHNNVSDKVHVRKIRLTAS